MEPRNNDPRYNDVPGPFLIHLILIINELNNVCCSKNAEYMLGLPRNNDIFGNSMAISI